jgi:flagellin-like protein
MAKIKRGRKAVSPIIATVLLIMMAIVLAIIILLWSRAFIKEQILKFDKPIETVCSEVSIKTFVNKDYTYGFTNTGNVPIYSVDVKISKKGSSDTVRADQGGQVDIGLSTVLNTNAIDPLSTTEIKIIPVLLGKNKEGAIKEYTCPEQSGFVLWEE